MITLRRAEDRHLARTRKREVWLSFFPREQGPDPLTGGFGCVEAFNEVRLPPGATIPSYPRHDAEIITFVRDGMLAHEDSVGRSGVLRTGEFQRMTAGRGVRHTETNASQSDWAHVFQIWVRPSEADLRPELEQKRFSTAERRNELCIIASPDGRRGSLRIHQDVLMFSAILEPGYHLVHALMAPRGAWLQVLEGEVCLGGDIVLAAGDGVGLTAELAVSLTAREQSELLLVDLCPQQQRVLEVCHEPPSCGARGHLP